jgi:hypothetical protein
MEIMKLFKNKKVLYGGLLLLLALIVVLIVTLSRKSSFNDELYSDNLTMEQPKNFPPLDETIEPTDSEIKLEPPTVPEEIGLAMKYPQGSGVGMSKLDSNAYTPDKPGSLLTEYKIPSAYGESSLADPTGINGADQGSRILRIGNLGDQLKFKGTDEAECKQFAKAYSDDNAEVQSGLKLLDGSNFINYSDQYVPSNNLLIESSPGQTSTINNCENTYPNTEKYKDYCITDGDIPYGQIVNNKVNPRLVDRWESYTGDYSREDALKGIDGLLYPTLNTLE